MATTYQTASDEVIGLLAKAMRHWHPNLAEAAVAIGVIMAFNPDGDAITHGGYPALAKIRPVSLKDRVSKLYDAELLIDEQEWSGLSPEQRLALLDHELSHLALVALSPKDLQSAREEDPNAPWWKLDDLGRPKLRSVPGDWNAGDGFKAVIARHGDHAIEYLNLSKTKARADAARAEGERGR